MKQSEKESLNDRNIINIDVEYYQQMLDDTELTDEEKRELIEVVWDIVINFVDMGFGIHPIQLVKAEREKHQLTNHTLNEDTLERREA